MYVNPLAANPVMFVKYKNGKKGVLGHGAKKHIHIEYRDSVEIEFFKCSHVGYTLSTMPTALLSSMLSLSCLTSDVSCSFHGSTVAYLVV